MSGFTSIFGGSNITPTQPSFLSLNPLTANVVLGWPLEQTGFGPNIAADIIEVNATAGGLTIELSDARQVSSGYTILFNNIGANTFTVLDSTGAVIVAVTSGTVWQIYLADNSTAAGTWRLFQYGAGASSANAAALAGAGLVAASTKLNETIVVQPKNANYVSIGTDLATCLEWTGGTGTITLPNAATVGTNWFVLIKNNGTGICTVSPPSGTIDLLSSLAFDPEQSAIVVCDGTNYFTVGFGQALNSIFDFVSINLTGQSSPYVLSGANLNRISYQFTGVLTAPMVVEVPNTVQQYWVDNETTGAFSLTIQPISGAGVAVTQGARNILYCNGTTVVAAVTFGSSGFPNGSAGAPSIFFAASPTTGLFSSSANSFNVATSGTQRLQVDSAGHFIFDGPDNTASIGFTFNQAVSGAGTTVQITSPFGSAAATPLLQLVSTAASGFATFSICGNNATPGTNDFSFFQNGATADTTIVNRANAALNFGTNGTTRFSISNAGTVTFNGNTITNGNAAFNAPILGSVSISTAAGGVGLALLTPATKTSVFSLAANGTSPGVADFQFEQDAAGNGIIQVNSGGTLSLNTNGTNTRFSISSAGALSGFGSTAAALVDMSPDTGTFNGTLTGGTTAPNVGVKWSKMGRLVTLEIANSATSFMASNSTGFTMTGIPAELRPTTSAAYLIPLGPMQDNSTDALNCYSSTPNGAGVITFYKGAATATSWTNAGNKGIGSPNNTNVGIVLTYSLD